MIYALSHGYAINRRSVGVEGPLQGINWTSRGAPWVKVSVGSALLGKFHGLCILDSDAFVYQIEKAVEPFLLSWRMAGPGASKSLAISREENPNLFSQGGRFNTGVLFVMNTKISHRLYQSWAHSVDGRRSCGSQYKNQWSYEQKPFELCLYNKKIFRKFIVALPPGKPVNLPTGTWIKHYPTFGYFNKHRKYSMQHALLNAVYRLEKWKGSISQPA
mmetsp:Transcript_12597/g.26569  ORF Transcript_12597/g.26569 Transcript_12597/m.26569 type:complete len:217 (+) Transcript_12597:686-1336(+)